MEIVALALFVFASSGTPGPNNVMLLTSGVNHGVRQTIPHVLGINIGFPFMVLGVGVGLMSIFATAPYLYHVIKVVGVIYLVYLAFKIATMPTDIKSKTEASAQPMSFLQAASFQWVNPKAWVMVVSAIVAFSNGTDSHWWEVPAIAAAYLVFGLPCSFAWVSIGASLQRVLSNEVALKWFNRVMAALLLLSISPMIQSNLELVQG